MLNWQYNNRTNDGNSFRNIKLRYHLNGRAAPCEYTGADYTPHNQDEAKTTKSAYKL